MNVFPSQYLYIIPALPLLGFLINGLMSMVLATQQKAGPKILSAIIACAGPLAAFGMGIWAFCFLAGQSGTAAIQAEPLFTWMSTGLFQIDFSFVVDHLSSVMLLVVTGVGSLIHIYAVGYMKEDESFVRFFAYLNLFLFFMLLLILGDNLLVLFVGWEGVGLCSYLLIGFWFTDKEKAVCGKKAFVVNRIGDFGFLVGLFYILFAFVSQSQSTDLNFFNFAFMAEHKEIFTPFATIITLCLFMGATGKSAQIPLYIWLPDAMAGPTPVSALIHAATMVTAGVYMVARLSFLYAMAPITLEVITYIGAGTALLAALIAVTQYDIKKVLAYSTVSQLGYMFLALGVQAPQAAIFHVFTHAFFKACLFMCAGSIIVALHHEQDIRKMGGLAKKMPATFFAFLVSTLAIAGIPPFAGFFSKDEILWQTYLHAPFFVYVVSIITAGLTAFYMFRLFAYVFLGSFRGHHEAHDVGFVMNGPVVILGLLAMGAGFLGVPHVLGGENHFHAWLAYLTPVVESLEDHHSLEMMLMGISTAWAVVMSLFAVVAYRRKLDWTNNIKITFKPIYNLMDNRFYVDEIYNALIVNPIKNASQVILSRGVDQKLIDGVLVHGWAHISQVGARLVSLWQTGLVRNYLFFMWVGLIGLLAIILL